ncbi:hypothetical protein [Hamadaea flava]|uniref:hypothetical protein n=1 Tax=Hamadaea flava TaxID=1742688 RepID=UPI0020A5B11A|nr:hypothetical protein [Hamadaea flava]
MNVADLRAFLDEFADLEIMPAPRARALAGNVRRLLDDVGVLDTDVLADLSVPDLLDLYSQARPGLTRTTRGTYLSQLTRAIAMVTARAADDPLWALTARQRKPAQQATGRRTTAASRGPAATGKPAARAKPATGKPSPSTSANAGRQRPAPAPEQPAAPVSPAAQSMIIYPFPLRDGKRAELTLPALLTTADATRLTAFITALAIEPPQPAR